MSARGVGFKNWNEGDYFWASFRFASWHMTIPYSMSATVVGKAMQRLSDLRIVLQLYWLLRIEFETLRALDGLAMVLPSE